MPSKNRQPRVVNVRPPGASSAPPVRALSPPSKRPDGSPAVDDSLTEVRIEPLGDLTAFGDAQQARAGRAAGARRTAARLVPEEPDAVDDLFSDPNSRPPVHYDPRARRTRAETEEGSQRRGSEPGRAARPDPAPDRTSVELPFEPPAAPVSSRRPGAQGQPARTAVPPAAAYSTERPGVVQAAAAPVGSPRAEATTRGGRRTDSAMSTDSSGTKQTKRRPAVVAPRWTLAHRAAFGASLLVSVVIVALSFRNHPGAAGEAHSRADEAAGPGRAVLPTPPPRRDRPAPTPMRDEGDEEEEEPEVAEPKAAPGQLAPTLSAPKSQRATREVRPWNNKRLAPVGPSCRPRGTPVRLARGVDPQVPAEVQLVEGAVVVGLATGVGVASGLVWAPGTDQVEVKYQADHPGLAGVIPLAGGDGPVFAVDAAENYGLTQARTLASRKRWAVGTLGGRLAAASVDAVTVELWRAPAGAQLGRPDTAAFDAKRHALALRVQGSAPSVQFGVFDIAVRKRWGFVEVPFSGRDLGRPAVATNGKYAAVAAAVAPTSGEPWRIQLALLDRDANLLLQAPLAFLPFPRFVDQISPKIAPLGAKNWLLQWTEGEALARKIQLLVLDENLQPVGEPVAVSPKGMNAGGGQLLGAELPTSVYLSQAADRYDAWLQPIDCR